MVVGWGGGSQSFGLYEVSSYKPFKTRGDVELGEKQAPKKDALCSLKRCKRKISKMDFQFKVRKKIMQFAAVCFSHSNIILHEFSDGVNTASNTD